MCFSSQASFVAGSILVVVGIATIKHVKNRSQILYASIPFLFGLQQFSEGFIWISLSDPHYAPWLFIPLYFYLVVAQSIWPVLVPLSILTMEKEIKRKKILYFLLACGLLFSIVLTIGLFITIKTAEIIHHHIQYDLHFPDWMKPYGTVLYFLSTIIPPFVSSQPKMKLMGLVILISYITSRFFFEDAVISIWCFFAALLSLGVYFVIKEQKPFPHS